MKKNYIKLSALSKEIGVSRQRIYEAKDKEQFPVEKINDQLFIDLNNKAVKEFIKSTLENQIEKSVKRKDKKSPIIAKRVEVKNQNKIKTKGDGEPIPGYLRKFADSQHLTFQELTSLSKTEVDKIKSYEQIKQIRTKTQRERKELIERKLIRVVFGKLYEIHQNEFLTVKSKVIPDLAGIFGNTNSEKMIEAEKRLDSELWDVLKHVKYNLDKFLIQQGESLE